jgi:hypothetical protein
VRNKVVWVGVALSFALVLTGCGNKNKEFSSIEELRDAFVSAGGQCWEWKKYDPVKDRITTHKGTAECDKNTVLVLFSDGVSSQNEGLDFASQMRSLNFEVNVLVGANWMINSDQAAKVYPQMGGTLITR